LSVVDYDVGSSVLARSGASSGDTSVQVGNTGLIFIGNEVRYWCGTARVRFFKSLKNESILDTTESEGLSSVDDIREGDFVRAWRISRISARRFVWSFIN
jgi:hypothetical protein